MQRQVYGVLMKYYVPSTARGIVESLLIEKNWTIKQIAGAVGVTPRTVYRIRDGNNPLPETYLNLIYLYLNLQQEIIVAEEGSGP